MRDAEAVSAEHARVAERKRIRSDRPAVIALWSAASGEPGIDRLTDLWTCVAIIVIRPCGDLNFKHHELGCGPDLGSGGRDLVFRFSRPLPMTIDSRVAGA